MLIKIFIFIYILYDILILFQTKKRALKDINKISENTQKIKKIRRFKNMESTCNKKMTEIVTIINKRKAIAFINVVMPLLGIIVFGVCAICEKGLYVPIFIIGGWTSNWPPFKIDWDRTYRTGYKAIKIFELFFLTAVMYG